MQNKLTIKTLKINCDGSDGLGKVDIPLYLKKRQASVHSYSFAYEVFFKVSANLECADPANTYLEVGFDKEELKDCILNSTTGNINNLNTSGIGKLNPDYSVNTEGANIKVTPKGGDITGGYIEIYISVMEYDL